MDKKTKSILAIVVIILIIIAVICFNNKSNVDKNSNNSNDNITAQEKEGITETKQIKDYEIFNANISVKSEITSFKAYIKNTSKETKENKEFDIELLGENQEILGTLTVHIEKLEPNEIKQVSSEIWKGIQNVKDYRVIEK